MRGFVAMCKSFLYTFFLLILIPGSIQSAERFIGTDRELVRILGFRAAGLSFASIEAGNSVERRILHLSYNGIERVSLEIVCPYNSGYPSVTYAVFGNNRPSLLFAQSMPSNKAGFVAMINRQRVEADINGVDTSIALVQNESSKEALASIESILDFPSGSMQRSYRFFLMEEISKTGFFGLGSVGLGVLGVRSFVTSNASLKKRKAALVAYGSGASFLADKAKYHGSITRDLYDFFDQNAQNNRLTD